VIDSFFARKTYREFAFFMEREKLSFENLLHYCSVGYKSSGTLRALQHPYGAHFEPPTFKRNRPRQNIEVRIAVMAVSFRVEGVG
jgi:hypothetical protein